MSTPSLSTLLQLKKNDVVSVVGAGGKSSIISLLAEENKQHGVLVSPTTKIFSPTYTRSPFSELFTTVKACQNLANETQKEEIGITYAGILHQDTQKLSALPETLLATLCEQYSLSLLEADGSRTLPCKGWLANEPVVTAFTTVTIGIITLNGLNKPATEQTVLHMPEFSSLTGCAEYHPITLQHLAAMVARPQGMLKNSRGKIQLIINQIETPEEKKLAISLISLIRKTTTVPIHRFIFGSAHQNHWNLFH